MKNKILLTICLFFLVSSSLIYASDEKESYSLARQAIKAGDKDAAFFHFLAISREPSRSKYREQALFAIGEYYFGISDYHDAFSCLKKLLQDYPESKMKLIALFYLFKIAQIRQNDDLAKQCSEKIINLKQVILIFSDVKEYKYASLSGTKYKIAYYIDKIEFYINGKLSTQISY